MTKAVHDVHGALTPSHRAAITKLANARSNGYPPNWTKRFGLTYGQALLSQVLDTAAERMEAPWHTAFELAAFKL